MSPLTAILAFIGAIVVLLLISAVKILPEYERSVLLRLGREKGIRGPGLFFIIPMIDRILRVDLRTITKQLETQETVTKDGVAVNVNAVIWYKVVDPIKALIGVVNWREAVNQAAETALRDTIGQNELDGLLKNRDKVNEALRINLAIATPPWGVQVEKVEVKDLDIPENMQRAIAKEAEAIREKRARIIKAEGEFEASTKLAEAARIIAASPGALQLRQLQTMSEIGVEHNSTIIVAMPTSNDAATTAALARAVAQST